MSYLDRLKQQIAEKGIPDQPPKPPEPRFGGFGGNPRGHISETQARATLREWYARLSRLDPDRPPDGCNAWWRQAVEDSCWLYEGFAGRAVRDGWSALDLFGVWPAKPGWGGLVDRLRGARDLKMAADRAAWTVGGVRERFCRGAGDDLKADLLLIWEIGK